jgi:hypothetical protein
MEDAAAVDDDVKTTREGATADQLGKKCSRAAASRAASGSATRGAGTRWVMRRRPISMASVAAPMAKSAGEAVPAHLPHGGHALDVVRGRAWAD